MRASQLFGYLVDSNIKEMIAMNEEKVNHENPVSGSKKTAVWDCESTLYDSFELESFERHLSSAIDGRSLSMSHIPHRKFFHLDDTKSGSKGRSPGYSSFQRIFKHMFKSKNHYLRRSDGYEPPPIRKSSGLMAIPEELMEDLNRYHRRSYAVAADLCR